MAKAFEGLLSFVEFLEERAVISEESLRAAAGASSVILQHNTKAIFGDAGRLVPLADSTQIERERLGYSANDPLVRTGELRDSVERTVEGNSAGVGTSDPVMIYHEFGTGHIPPRPVFEMALKDSEDEVMAISAQSVGFTLGFVRAPYFVEE